MKAKQVGAKQGLQWIVNGFYLFRSSPLIWIILCGTLLGIAVAFSFVQTIGQIIFTLFSPVFMA